MMDHDNTDKVSYSDAWIEYSKQEKLHHGRPVEAEAVKLIREIDMPSIDEIIDIGCGSAGLLERLVLDKVPFGSYLGLDKNLDILQAAKAIGAPNSRFLQWDLETPEPLEFDQNGSHIFTLIRILNNINDDACETLLRYLKDYYSQSGFVIINPANCVVAPTANRDQTTAIDLNSMMAFEKFQGSSATHYQRAHEQYLIALKQLGYSRVYSRDLCLKGSKTPTHTALFGII